MGLWIQTAASSRAHLELGSKTQVGAGRKTQAVAGEEDTGRGWLCPLATACLAEWLNQHEKAD